MAKETRDAGIRFAACGPDRPGHRRGGRGGCGPASGPPGGRKPHPRLDQGRTAFRRRRIRGHEQHGRRRAGLAHPARRRVVRHASFDARSREAPERPRAARRVSRERRVGLDEPLARLRRPGHRPLPDDPRRELARAAARGRHDRRGPRRGGARDARAVRACGRRGPQLHAGARDHHVRDLRLVGDPRERREGLSPGARRPAALHGAAHVPDPPDQRAEPAREPVDATLRQRLRGRGADRDDAGAHHGRGVRPAARVLRAGDLPRASS